MKKFQWIIVAVLTAMTMTAAAGCSHKEEPELKLNEDGTPIYDGGHLIVGDKIYIKLYAPKGMKYAPVAAENLPKELYSEEVKKSDRFRFELEYMILFQGEFNGQHIYWSQADWDSSFYPHLIYVPDGYPIEDIPSFSEVYPELTCIYIGKNHHFVVIVNE